MTTKGPPLIRFFQPIQMHNPGVSKGFCSKRCYLRPLSDLFMNVMQKPGSDLPYDIVPGAPSSDAQTFVWRSQEYVAKIY